MEFKANVIKRKYGVTVIMADQTPRTVPVTAESEDTARIYISFLAATDPEYAGCRILAVEEAHDGG